MSTCPLKAIKGSMIIEQDDKISETDSGIIMTKDIRSFRQGTVLSVGKDCKHYQKGDRILYVKEAAYPIVMDEYTDNEHTYYFIDNEDDVYVKITD